MSTPHLSRRRFPAMPLRFKSTLPPRVSSSLKKGNRLACFLKFGKDNRSRTDTMPINCSEEMQIERIEQSGDWDVNVLQWLQNSCPSDVVPKVLAFAGPQKTRHLQSVNRHFRNIVSQEIFWRSMCEELYKWKDGDTEPSSWFQLYCASPCVPVDYPTIEMALKTVTTTRPIRLSQRGRSEAVQSSSVRILLRPGDYVLEEAINVCATNNSCVTIETMKLPQNLYVAPVCQAPQQQPSIINRSQHQPSLMSSTTSTPASSSPPSNKRFRDFMLCHRSNSVKDEAEYMEISSGLKNESQCANLVLWTRRSNEPCFRVRQGRLILKNMEVNHFSSGIDIWNGNAALQIQPPADTNGMPLEANPPPEVLLEGIKISSRSGRGIVNIEGGAFVARSCAIHDCAATGIYIGGSSSRCIMEYTDVVNNGIGNIAHSRSGVMRGHSGVYLEQGLALIKHCNISRNTLTGISSVSLDNSILHLEDTQIMSNGTFQLELPPPGTVARRRSTFSNNHMANLGIAVSKSGLLPLSPTVPNNDGDEHLF